MKSCELSWRSPSVSADGESASRTTAMAVLSCPRPPVSAATTAILCAVVGNGHGAHSVRRDEGNSDADDNTSPAMAAALPNASFGVPMAEAGMRQPGVTRGPLSSRQAGDDDMPTTAVFRQQAARVRIGPRRHHQIHGLTLSDARRLQRVDRRIALAAHGSREIDICRRCHRKNVHGRFLTVFPWQGNRRPGDGPLHSVFAFLA